MYQPLNFDHLIGTPGFSDILLKNHFTLYQGYVTNTNKLQDELKQLVADKNIASPRFSEIKRRFGWEWNGMRLHELYFGNMKNGGAPLATAESLEQKINTEFGSYENWLTDFKATGTMRGIGWTILAQDTANGQLFNTWITEHDAGHLAGATPLLVLDVFEHAYISDYGLKRADYIDAFLKAVDWDTANTRLKN